MQKNVSKSKLIKFVGACLGAVRGLPAYSSKFSRKDFTLKQHVVLLCLKVKTKQKYREFCELLAEMPHVQGLLGLQKIPHWTTLDKAFLRLKNCVFSVLLNAKPSGFASVDATGFDRWHASKHYTKRAKMEIKSMKATFLIDTESQKILGMHCTASRKHDSRIVLPLVQKHRLKVLCADKGYYDKKVRDALRAHGTRPLIKHREFRNLHKAWNARIDNALYHQRSKSETVNSVIKRTLSDTLYSRTFWNQRKELTLLAFVYNVNREIMAFFRGFLRSLALYLFMRSVAARHISVARTTSLTFTSARIFSTYSEGL